MQFISSETKMKKVWKIDIVSLATPNVDKKFLRLLLTVNNE